MDQVDSSVSSGIAKKVIVEFFGLIKGKFKKVMIKKLLLFIQSIFQNSDFVQTFKMTLVEMGSQNLLNLISLFTQFYRILALIKSEDSKVLSFRDSILQKIVNLFPLDLKLILFEPLLPSQHLYQYLGDQLEEHSIERTKFKKLGDLVSIIPSDATFEWVKFMRQCMKRGNQPSPQAVAEIFDLV